MTLAEQLINAERSNSVLQKDRDRLKKELATAQEDLEIQKERIHILEMQLGERMGARAVAIPKDRLETRVAREVLRELRLKKNWKPIVKNARRVRS